MFDHNTQRRFTHVGWLLHAAGLLATVASVAGIVVFVFGSLDAQSIELAFQSTELRQSVRNSDEIIANNRELRKTLDEVNQRIKHLSSQIPQTAQESEFLAQLSRLAQSSGLEIDNYQPGIAKKVEKHRALDVALTINGNYQSMCQFFAGIQNLPRVCRINTLRILNQKSSNSDDDILSITMSMTIYYAPASTQLRT